MGAPQHTAAFAGLPAEVQPYLECKRLDYAAQLTPAIRAASVAIIARAVTPQDRIAALAGLTDALMTELARAIRHGAAPADRAVHAQTVIGALTDQLAEQARFERAFVHARLVADLTHPENQEPQA